MSKKVRIPQSEAEKTLLEISGDQWSEYQDMFIPLEDSWLQDISQREGDRQQGADIMAAEAAHNFGQFEQQSYDKAFASGIAPSSGAFLSLATDLASEKADAASSGITMARNAETMDFANNGLKAMQYGRGIGSEGISGTFASGARTLAAEDMERRQSEFNSNAKDQTREALYGTMGGIAGIGAGYGLNQATKKGGSAIRIQGPSGSPTQGATIQGGYTTIQDIG